MDRLQFSHGMLACCEWTGVLLSTLLEEVGVKKGASWILAEGSDGSHMSRSIPMDKALDVESKYFTQLLMDPTSRNMTRTLFLSKGEADKLVRRPAGPEKRSVTKLGILGAGMMGAGIAYVSARAGIEVVLLSGDHRGTIEALAQPLDQAIRELQHAPSDLAPRVNADASALPFHDLGSGEGWALRPNTGRLPWWLFAPSRRQPLGIGQSCDRSLRIQYQRRGDNRPG